MRSSWHEKTSTAGFIHFNSLKRSLLSSRTRCTNVWEHRVDYLLYNFISMVALLLSLPFTPFLFLLGNRFSSGLGQRFAFYPRAAVEALRASRVIWIHAASVGEVDAASRLRVEISRRLPGCTIVISTFTASGNLRARQNDSADAIAVFACA